MTYMIKPWAEDDIYGQPLKAKLQHKGPRWYLSEQTLGPDVTYMMFVLSKG